MAERVGLSPFWARNPLLYKFILQIKRFLIGRCYTEVLHHAEFQDAYPHHPTDV